MNAGERFAFITYLIIGLGTAVTGLIYLFSSKIMPYHEAAIGVNWEQLSPPLKIILLALVRAAGAGFLGVGAAISCLVIFAFRQGTIWVRYILPLEIWILYVPLLYVTFHVKMNTAGSPPCYLVLASLVMTVPAFILSVSRKK